MEHEESIISIRMPIRHMKKGIVIGMIGLLMAGCGDGRQEAADTLLRETRGLYEQGDLEGARAGIDSLRKAYPDLVSIRKATLALHQDVELKIAQRELARTDSVLQIANKELEALQQQVDADKAALKATPEELTQLTRTRMRRDSIRTQFETLGAKIRYIHQKQKELQD